MKATYNYISKQQKGTDFLQHSSLPTQLVIETWSQEVGGLIAVHNNAHLSVLWQNMGVTVQSCLPHHVVGLPVEALDDEVVLQAELEHRQHGPGQVEGVQVPSGSCCHHGHNGEVADDELSHGGADQQPHVQAAGGVLLRHVLPVVQPVDDAADHSGEGHHAHYHYVHDEMNQQAVVSVPLVLFKNVHLVQYEGDESRHHQEDSR